jgi:sulfur carrier protein ThiS
MARPHLAVAALLLAAPLTAWSDVPTVHRFRPEMTPVTDFPPGETLPVFPDLAPTADAPQSKDAHKSDRMDQRDRIEILRAISGEFARAVCALPSGRKGIHIKAGKPVDEEAVLRAVRLGGAAANPGDQVQVTAIEFHDREIVVDVNGGGRQHTRWRDRIHLEVGGAPTARMDQTGSQGLQKAGTTIYLDFDQRLPELTPEQIKQFLSAFLDFAKQRSAAVQWVETLPPEVQTAIKEKRALVGMDQEMVIAALGRPDKKVRERDDDGLETEDWIYGHPPERTVFVKFAGEKVITVKQYPN